MAEGMLWLTIDWHGADVDLPEELQERFTVAQLQELRELEEVTQVQRVADPEVPEGGMGAAWLLGLLQAEVNFANLQKVVRIVRDRIPGKPINFTVEANGRKFSVENVRPEELDATLDKLLAAAKKLAED